MESMLRLVLPIQEHRKCSLTEMFAENKDKGGTGSETHFLNHSTFAEDWSTGGIRLRSKKLSMNRNYVTFWQK
jgi:hypothetical protein